MVQRNWSMQDAKHRVSDVIEAARHAPQVITKRGRPVVVVMGAAEYERLRRVKRTPALSFAAALLAMPQDNGEFPRSLVRIHN